MLLVGKNTDKTVVLRFGIPAFVSSFAGALLLVRLSDLQPLYSYILLGKEYSITPVKFIIAILLILFSLTEIIPYFRNLQFDRKYLMIGGALSGFFGGLSGHQGALRSAFLIKIGFDKTTYIATGIAIACLVDLSRLGVYSTRFLQSGLHDNLLLVIVATLSAFSGALLGNRLLKKVTLQGVQIFVTTMLIILAIIIGTGII